MNIMSVTLWVWAIAVAGVLTLALYRLVATWGKYTVLHVRPSELSLVPEQIVQQRRVDRIEFWGQLLTVVVLVIGLALVLAYLITAAAAM